MKRVILILAMVLVVFTAVRAQTPGDSTNLVTVRDTTFVNDERLIFLSQTILPAMTKFVEEYNRKQKVDGKEVQFKTQTGAFIRKFERELNDYALNFMRVSNIQIDSAQIVTEFEALNTRIAALEADPDAKYIEVMSEFQRIQKRQAVLAKYYQQIMAQ